MRILNVWKKMRNKKTIQKRKHKRTRERKMSPKWVEEYETKTK